MRVSGGRIRAGGGWMEAKEAVRGLRRQCGPGGD